MSTILDEFRNNKYAAIRIGSPRESEVKDNVGVPRLSARCVVSRARERWYENLDSLEKAPFSFKVLGDIVLCRGKYLFDSDIYAKVRPYKARELECD